MNILAKIFPSSDGSGKSSKRIKLLFVGLMVAPLMERFLGVPHETAIAMMQSVIAGVLGISASDAAKLWKGGNGKKE